MPIALKLVPSKLRVFQDERWTWSLPKKVQGGWVNGVVDEEVLNSDVPVKVKHIDRVRLDYWMYNRDIYATSDLELTPHDVMALLNEAHNKRRIQLEKAHALQAMSEELDSRARRAPIPQDVKVLVWQRDKGRCVECDSQKDLEFDHVIPVSMGGSNTARNLQLLCEPCNRRKGASLG